MFEYTKQHGWPEQKQISDADGKESNVKASDGFDYDGAKDFPLYAIGRLARNMNREHAQSLAKFEMIEAGLLNLVAKKGKQDVEGGQLMFMTEGVLLSDDDREPLQETTSDMRLLFVVTGVIWAPFVFDVHMCEFLNADDSLEMGHGCCLVASACGWSCCWW